MSQRFDLLTTGRLRAGFTDADAIPELAALLRRDPAVARRLLRHGLTIVKRGLTREEAVTLGRRLQAAGLEVKAAHSTAPAAADLELEPEGLDHPDATAPHPPAAAPEPHAPADRKPARAAARAADRPADRSSDRKSDSLPEPRTARPVPAPAAPADSLSDRPSAADFPPAPGLPTPPVPGDLRSDTLRPGDLPPGDLQSGDHLPEQPRFTLPRGNGCPRTAFAAAALGPFVGVLAGAALTLGLMRWLGGTAILAAPPLVWAGLIGGLAAGEALGGRCQAPGRLTLAMAPALTAAVGLGAAAVAASLHAFPDSSRAGLLALGAGLALLPAPALPALLARRRLHRPWCEKCQRPYRAETVLDSATASPVKVLQKLLARTLPDPDAVEADAAFPALDGQRAVRVEREWCPGCGDAIVTAWLVRRDGRGIFHSRFWGDLKSVRRAIRARGGAVLPAPAPRPLSRPHRTALLAGAILLLAAPLGLMAASLLPSLRTGTGTAEAPAPAAPAAPVAPIAPAAPPSVAPAATPIAPADAAVARVRDGALPYADLPVGRVLDGYPYLSARRWRSFTDDRGRTMVEFRGTLDPARAALAPLGAASGDLVLQFALDAQGPGFALSWAGLDLAAPDGRRTRDLDTPALERLFSGRDVLAAPTE